MRDIKRFDHRESAKVYYGMQEERFGKVSTDLLQLGAPPRIHLPPRR